MARPTIDDAYEDPCPVCDATIEEVDAFLAERGLKTNYGRVMDDYREPHNWLMDQGLTGAWLRAHRESKKEG